jgi:hypothetical protein
MISSENRFPLFGIMSLGIVEDDADSMAMA